MQINKQNEIEVNLKDLFFELLYKWRSILVAALIGMILLGAYQYYSIYKVHSEGKQTKEEKQYEFDLQNYQDSIKNANLSIRTYNKLIKEQYDYLNESVYMSLDSQNEWLAYKSFFIKMDQSVLDALPESSQEDPTDYVAAVYTSTLKSGLDAEEMEALLGTGKQEYIDELVFVRSDSPTNTVTIQVVGADKETVMKQMDYFVSRMETVSQPMAQAVGAHTLSLVNEDVMSRTDSGLSAKQDEINQQLATWQEELKKQRETLNDLEAQKEPVAPGTHVKKYAAIGFILGAFLLAAIYTVRYMLSGKLHTSQEMDENLGLPVLGEYANSRARRSGKGLDKLFEKWEFKHAVTDPQVVTASIAALLKERYNGKRLMLAGTVSQEDADTLRKELDQRLGGDNTISARGGLPSNSDAIAAMKDADVVILVEKKHASRVADIQRTAELMMISQANVEGCIVL